MYKQILQRYITQELLSNRGDRPVGEDDNLLGSGVLDSVGMMSLVLFIENEFRLQVPPEDVTIEHFLSISTIEAYLSRRRTP
jgi:acyl carrier protein